MFYFTRTVNQNWLCLKQIQFSKKRNDALNSVFSHGFYIVWVNITLLLYGLSEHLLENNLMNRVLMNLHWLPTRLHIEYKSLLLTFWATSARLK